MGSGKYPTLDILSKEMNAARFGDERLSKRLGQIVDLVARKPAEGFPSALGTEADVEAFYRFLSNEKVSHQKILAPHIQATVSRVLKLDEAVIVHDTTVFQFGGDAKRDGLGITTTHSQGFYAHFALAVSNSNSHRPLGVAGLRTFCRTGLKYRSGRYTPRHKRLLSELQGDPTKESLRWGNLVEDVEMNLGGFAGAVHVMDREADCYDLFAQMVNNNRRFVIRLARNRKLFDGKDTFRGGLDLFAELEDFPDVVEREVPLSARRKTSPYYCAGRHPIRRQRIAKLRFSASQILVKRAQSAHKSWPAFLKLNVVRVYEINSPSGEDPVEWLLITTEPIKTKKHVEKIVDYYRCRWLIEEYFKALKTGCAFEKRQLESYPALLKALAVLAPIAWRLLLIRNLERSEPEAPATEAITKRQVEILKEISKRPLSESPTIKETLLAIAALGGHLKNNGPPGWQILGRGYNELLSIERGWMARERKM